MIEYKNATFYTEFFKSIDGFSVIEDFCTSEDKRDENLYVGRIEVLNTVHPLNIRVEIPFTFPHNKLVFRTNSLSGYPHLIHSGKTHIGDWFCLNTPFAETAEEQLELEVQRLKEWIERQMREDLPAIIEDLDVRHALAFANAYEWENPDEVKEFSSSAALTFVGDFQDKEEYFKESVGFLDCIKSPDNRFFVIDDAKSTNYKLPYIIEEEIPPTLDIFLDFIKLRDYYAWDDKTCKHLLPNIEISTSWQESSSQPYNLSESKLSTEEKLSLIETVEKELQKEDSYLYSSNDFLNSTKKPAKVLPAQKSILLGKVLKMKDEVRNSKPEDKTYSIFNPNYDDMSEEERAEKLYKEYYFEEVYPFEWHHFAFGFKYNGKVLWYLLYTNRNSKQVETINYDLGLKDYCIERIISQSLHRLLPQMISKEMYYGRGSFGEKLISKKVALVGLGAIGSMVAVALAKSGINHIGLWDNDIVEPGNICRSSYCMKDIGESKVNAIYRAITSINPYIEKVVTHGWWHEFGANHTEFINGSFYANVNYNTQKKAIDEIKGYDLIIDCTGSNEMLHFLSYAVPETELISICITNQANELLCISNRDGNPFELRRAYLSRIEQDTKNFYVEGCGCYSPTFLASNCDIAALVNLALREINKSYESGQTMPSTIYSYTERGIIADRLYTYRLPGYDITLNISSETMYDAEEMNDSINGEIGYILGCYDRKRKQIMITHIVDSHNATELLADAFQTSKGLIDYIGDYTYSGEKPDTYNESSLESIAAKAEDTEINTNNPLLAVRNPNGTVSFFLYINNELVKFNRQS